MTAVIGHPGGCIDSLRAWVDRQARAAGVDLNDARVLAAHALGVPRARLLALDAPPAPDAQSRVAGLLARRAAGEPVAQLVGEREFWGRPFRVTADVLIPRPETELLIERSLAVAQSAAAGMSDTGPLRIVDLGTGSGAIAVTLALELPGARITATDSSPAALAVARSNAERLGAVHIEFLQGHWYDALPGAARFDLIVSNPPYIAADDPHLTQGDLRYEPRSALTDGADGLRAIAAIAAGAAAHLRPGGTLLLEHGWDQAGAVRQILQCAGLVDLRSWPDLVGHARVASASARTLLG